MPAVNDPIPTSEVRRVRLRVVVNGKDSAGAYEATVATNNRLEAARWTASFACQVETELTAAWWSEQKDVPVAVHVGFEQDNGATDWKLLVSGTTDAVHYQPAQNTIRVEGRDLASRLIDADTRETFANKRASEIVEILAGRHGMKADVTPTSTLAGTYYQLEHDKITTDGFSKTTKEWNLLVYLAQRENYDLWVEGDTIHFHPAEKPDTDNLWLIRWNPPEGPALVPSMNVSGLTCERSLTIARDLKVIVKTFSSKGNRSIQAVYPNKSGGSSGGRTSGGNNVQTRVFLRPGLSQAQAVQEAQRLHREITQNERIINAEMPGDLILNPRMMVKLEGTGTSWDQNYYIDEVHREIGWERGFSQQLRCKNTSPRNEASVG